jgi:tetratricopeptide (TPR) repeat protein
LNSLRAAYARLADAQAHTGDLEGAAQTFTKALQVAGEVNQRADATQQQRYDLAGLHHTFGDMLGAPDDPNLGDVDGALRHYRVAADLSETIAAADPRDVSAKRNLAASYRRIGFMLVERDAVESLKHYRKAFPIAEAIRQGDASNIEYRSALAHILMGTGMALHRLGKETEALENLNRAIEFQESIETVAPNRVWLLRNTSRCYMVKGDVLFAQGNFRAALDAYREGLTAAERLVGRTPTSLHHRLDQADLLEAIGRYYSAMSSDRRTAATVKMELREKARDAYRSSLEIWQEWTRRQAAASYAARRGRNVAAAIAALGAN